MSTAFVIQLDPTCKQTTALARAAGCARFAYNWGLVEWERQYKEGLKPSWSKVQKAFNEIKKDEFPWIYDSPKDANQHAFVDLGKAYSNYFSSLNGTRIGPKMGHPKKHKKGVNDSFYISNDKFHFAKKGKFVKLPVIGTVKLHKGRRIEGKILGASVSRVADRWFLSVQVECENRVPNTPLREITGVDLGLKTAVVTSYGEEFQAPKPLKASLKKLRRANKSLHRKVKGSKNRRKAALKCAKIHYRIANQREDFMHKTTTRLCRENQTVIAETLNVAGMLKNHKLARALSDVGFGMFRTFLTYKAEKFGCNLILADQWFPSSKRCHMCGNVKENLDLSERTYICDQCGLVEDRDRNAALNLELYPGLLGNIKPVDTKVSTQRPKLSKLSERSRNRTGSLVRSK
jgi:putative transposase